MKQKIPANDYPALKYLQIYSKSRPRIYEAYEELTSKPRSDLISETIKMLIQKKYERPIISPATYQKALYSAVTLICLGEWRKYKNVYSFSKPLKDSLCSMNDFKMLPEVFEYLPYSSFFVESNHEDFSGAFVKYLKSDNQKFLLIAMLSKNSSRSLIMPMVLTDEKMINSQIREVLTSFPYDKDFKRKSTKEFLFYILQVSFYLSSKKPDLEEDAEQQKIYRKRERIRDKFSEIRKWNVGYRIVIDKKYDPYSKETSSIEGSKKRKHWRKAHWHTYRVGKGRTKKEIKFIPPILVNSHIEDNLPIVNHVQKDEN